MFDFGIYISLLLTIAICYISSIVTLNIERNHLDIDISNASSDSNKNIILEKQQKVNLYLKYIKICTLSLIIIISFLYFFMK